MAPKRATRSTPTTTTTPATTTTVTNAQLQAMIDEGVSAALAARDATRNGTDSHSSGTGVRGSERVARECTYQDFIEKKYTDKYCPRNEMKKLEAELWNLKIVGGLPDMIHGNIVASKPKTMQAAYRNGHELMDKRVSSMRKDKLKTRGVCPNAPKCNYHHDGPCAPKCYKCNKYGHIARDCRGTGNANNNNQKGTGSGQKPTCFECGVQGHFQKDCPRLKNNKGNRGNQAGNNRAPAKSKARARKASEDNIGFAGRECVVLLSSQMWNFGFPKVQIPRFLVDLKVKEFMWIQAMIEFHLGLASPKSPNGSLSYVLGLAGYYRRIYRRVFQDRQTYDKSPRED
ncbi:putative reverse transcriptase domain-containing protein [Tanacetum coccineum]|uniref:Reverse transcriptase domain-containing protein n=1 Tax=Tanacetum coccineum TaxID=301880 RepID=A0ABQ5AQ13_9ASTR